jgi:hypothetical protein
VFERSWLLPFRGDGRGVGDGRMDVNVHAIGTKPAKAD